MTVPDNRTIGEYKSDRGKCQQPTSDSKMVTCFTVEIDPNSARGAVCTAGSQNELTKGRIRTQVHWGHYVLQGSVMMEGEASCDHLHVVGTHK